MRHCSVKTRIGFREFELNADMGFFEEFQKETGKCAMLTAMKVVDSVNKANEAGESVIQHIAKSISMIDCIKFLHAATRGSASEQEIKEQVMFCGPNGRVIDDRFFEQNFDLEAHVHYKSIITSETLDSFYLPVYELSLVIVQDCYVAFENDATGTSDKKKAEALKRCVTN